MISVVRLKEGLIVGTAALVMAALVWVGMAIAVYGQDKKVEKAPPAEVKVPEAKQDKIRLIQKEREILQLKLQNLYNEAVQKAKDSPEWKALEADSTEQGRRLSTELQAVLKGAGVDEKDFLKYQYNMDTLTFTLPKPEDKKK